MSDGLTVPFALAAGLSGASIANSLIVTAGIAELVAGAISMGLGGYLAGQSEVEHYDSEMVREGYEIDQIPKAERQEVRDILKKFGISTETQDRFVDELSTSKSKWLQFMMEFELGLQKPERANIKWGALRIGLSYALGGLVPLLAYMVTTTPRHGLLVSSALTVVALGFFGYLKSRFLSQPRLKGAVRMIVVGAMAASVSFIVARFAL